MIEKNSKEWELWKDAYNLKNELTPPPDYSKSDNYWKEVLEKVHNAYNRYKDTYLKTLAEHLYLGIILQLEQESIAKGQAQSLINGVAEKLTAETWAD